MLTRFRQGSRLCQVCWGLTHRPRQPASPIGRNHHIPHGVQETRLERTSATVCRCHWTTATHTASMRGQAADGRTSTGALSLAEASGADTDPASAMRRERRFAPRVRAWRSCHWVYRAVGGSIDAGIPRGKPGSRAGWMPSSVHPHGGRAHGRDVRPGSESGVALHVRYRQAGSARQQCSPAGCHYRPSDNGAGLA